MPAGKTEVCRPRRPPHSHGTAGTAGRGCPPSKVRVYGSNFFEDFHSAPDDAPARSALVSLQHLGEEEEEPGRPPGPTRAEPASAAHAAPRGPPARLNCFWTGREFQVGVE